VNAFANAPEYRIKRPDLQDILALLSEIEAPSIEYQENQLAMAHEALRECAAFANAIRDMLPGSEL